MSNNEKGQEDFFHPQPFSLRAIDPAWIDKRCNEIAQDTDYTSGELVLQAALEEVLTQLVERTGSNFDDTREPFVHIPDVEGQPYVMMIPIRGVSLSKRPKAD